MESQMYRFKTEPSKYKTIRRGELPKTPPKPARANRRNNCAKLLLYDAVFVYCFFISSAVRLFITAEEIN
jgi:hypothetical protein